MNTDNQNQKSFIDKLHKEHTLTKEEWITLIEGRTPELSEYLFSLARKERHRYYGHDVYVRGLIEFTNYCKNDCLYCGIRKSNGNAHRYRLSEEDILNCCKEGYDLGFRTFVLQGGEDGYYTDERIIHLIRMIKEQYPDCAITLSIGEKSKESYQAYFDAGADRYLLRHETYNHEHYRQLHPSNLSPGHRQQCLRNLKDIGYQVGCGFMVGSPYQTPEYLAEDMLFMKELNPHMIGIGPLQPDSLWISSAFPDSVCTGRIHHRYRSYYHIEDNLSVLPLVKGSALRHWRLPGFQVHAPLGGWFQVRLWQEVKPSGSSAG